MGVMGRSSEEIMVSEGMMLMVFVWGFSHWNLELLEVGYIVRVVA